MKFTSKNLKKLKEKSLSNVEMLDFIDGKAHVYTYPELAKFKNIEDAFKPYNIIFLLYESRDGYGHWVTLINKRHSIEHFDSYGYKPDDELKFVPEVFREENNMKLPHLTCLLYKSKKKIEYNDYPLQEQKRDIATCGRWAVIRALFKKINVDEFIKLFINKRKSPDDLVTILTYII